MPLPRIRLFSHHGEDALHEAPVTGEEKVVHVAENQAAGCPGAKPEGVLVEEHSSPGGKELNRGSEKDRYEKCQKTNLLHVNSGDEHN